MLTVDELLETLTQIAFLVLGILSLVDYLRVRDAVHRDIALFFASLAVTVVLSPVGERLNLPEIVLDAGPLLVLTAHPYLLLRLLEYFQTVPLYLRMGAPVAMVIFWVMLLAMAPGLPTFLVVALLVYFVVVDGYAAVALIRGAFNRSGVVQQRLRFAAAGSGLVALALGWSALGFFMPQIETVTNSLLQLTGIAAAATFYLGLATPQWLRQTWQLGELHQFLQQVMDISRSEAAEDAYKTLGHGVMEATGGEKAVILIRDEAQGGWLPYDPDTGGSGEPLQLPEDLLTHWRDRTSAAIPVHGLSPALHGDLPPGAAKMIYVAPLARYTRVWGLVLVFLEHGSLFVADDLQLIRLFAEQSAMVLENLDLIDQQRRYAETLEDQVQLRTAELRRRNTHISLLQEVSRAANEATSVEEAFQEAVDLICHALEFSLGRVYMPSVASFDAFDSTEIWHGDTSKKYKDFYAATKKTRITWHDGNVGEVMQKARIRWYTHIAERQDFVRAEAAKDAGIVTGVFVPILVMDQSMAVLELFSEQELEANDDILDILYQVGAQLGRVIERQQAESRLRESENRFRSTFEQAAMGIAHVTESGRLLRINQRFGQIVGYQTDELLDGTLQDFTHPDDLHTDQDDIRRLLAGEIGDYALEKRYIRKDGHQIWVNLTVSLVSTEDGKPDYLIAVVEDISERKRLQDELRSLNQELEQRVQERTAHLRAVNQELEAFSYSVSHDLRAPLRAVDGFSLALLEDYGDAFDEAGQDFLNRIRTESQRMGQLIDDLLALSRFTRTEMHMTTVDLSRMVHDIAAELQARNPDRAVALSIQDGIEVWGDERLLRIVLQNLVGNAWKFTAKRPQALIEFGALDNDGVCEYYVRDNGAGFNMEYVAKLFGAFQRLHAMAEFEGTGIGLATVQRIIHRHGGTVRAEGAVDQGATFYFSLEPGKTDL